MLIALFFSRFFLVEIFSRLGPRICRISYSVFSCFILRLQLAVAAGRVFLFSAFEHGQVT
jgi:hypothetical protein